MNPPPGAQSYPSQTATGPARDDVALVRRIADGDENALAVMYDAWSTRVYSLVLQLLRDRDEAEDVVEKTFWQVWQRASSYDATRGTVSTWVLTIARSRALDRLRARMRERPDTMQSVAERAESDLGPSDPAIEAEGQERRAMVRTALHALPDDQRRALELAYFHGLSQSEIAEYLREPLGTIKTRMRLGMHKLRDQLGMFREDFA